MTNLESSEPGEDFLLEAYAKGLWVRGGDPLRFDAGASPEINDDLVFEEELKKREVRGDDPL